MHRVVALGLAISVLQSCRFESRSSLLPVGFESVSRDRNSHFILVDPDYWGNKVKQREVGKIICEEIFDTKNYCEVYYFAAREDIPKQFPITNRMQPIGIYESKNGKVSLRILDNDKLTPRESRVVFYKDYVKRVSEYYRKRKFLDSEDK